MLFPLAVIPPLLEKALFRSATDGDNRLDRPPREEELPDAAITLLAVRSKDEGHLPVASPISPAESALDGPPGRKALPDSNALDKEDSEDSIIMVRWRFFGCKWHSDLN